jgi:sec-independent protein translocase protein TatA
MAALPPKKYVNRGGNEMFGGRLGFMELLVILVIVVMIFGAGKLPQIGKGLGEAITNFKKSVAGKEDEPKEEKPKEEKK